MADHDGSLERLVDALYARRPAYCGTDDAEAKGSHVDDLARRLADDGLTPSDLVARAASGKTLLRKARRKVLDQGLGTRDLTQPMRHTPRMLLEARAARVVGWLPGLSGRRDRRRGAPRRPQGDAHRWAGGDRAHRRLVRRAG